MSLCLTAYRLSGGVVHVAPLNPSVSRRRAMQRYARGGAFFSEPSNKELNDYLTRRMTSSTQKCARTTRPMFSLRRL